jgi:hypothetical protein
MTAGVDAHRKGVGALIVGRWGGQAPGTHGDLTLEWRSTVKQERLPGGPARLTSNFPD